MAVDTSSVIVNEPAQSVPDDNLGGGSQASTDENTRMRLQKELAATQARLEETNTNSSVALSTISRELHELSNRHFVLREELELSEQARADAAARIQELEQSVSFRLGATIVESTRSLGSLIRLPKRLFVLIREGLSRRAHRDLRVRSPVSTDSNTDRWKPDTPSAAEIADVRRVLTAKLSAHARPLRVAAVMDEFTFHAFSHECELVAITPDSWREQFSEEPPDLLFIESAWKGHEDSWERKISNATSEILEVIARCRSLKIPSVFWNKEDPVHFGTFLKIAQAVDFVFTTDIDCVPAYKKQLQHDRVYVLPFAAQPRAHNPLEKYERKHALCFAGSYYLRYPERQRDFASLVQAAESVGKLDVYDRNFGKSHPHYAFPDKYRHLILGRLPFEEIDRAYKGYLFGINVNTIKQSQTMCARRVFELLASNTIVVSNYSRALRLLFGDLVISSDKANELTQRLRRLVDDNLAYRKLRLMGLRKVLSEHTYAHRLAYIKAKICDRPAVERRPTIFILGSANTAGEQTSVIRSFRRQRVNEKVLYLLQAPGLSTPQDSDVTCFSDPQSLIEALRKGGAETSFFSVMSPADHYGPEFLSDLILARTYSDSDAFGKVAHYRNDGSGHTLCLDGTQYRDANRIDARCGIALLSAVSNEWLAACLKAPEDATFQLSSMLATDEFHYYRDAPYGASPEVCSLVEDAPAIRDGVSIDDDVFAVAEELRPIESGTDLDADLRQLSAEALHDSLVAPKTTLVTLQLESGVLKVESELPDEEHRYVYASEIVDRDHMNLTSSSTIRLDMDGSGNVQTLFEFFDPTDEKLGHSLNRAGPKAALAIPEDCARVRFGLRIQGKASLKIRRLLLAEPVEPPAVVLGRSRCIVVAKQYPDYEDLYRYGFLHSRLRAYRQFGLNPEVFRVSTGLNRPFREFEGIDVATGDLELLDRTLSSGRFDQALVHLIDRKMWDVLKPYLDRIDIRIWVHGAEIQTWERREYESALLTTQEKDRQRRLSESRVALWKEILTFPTDRISLVFVSDWLKTTALADLGIDSAQRSTEVIHNFIDADTFRYVPKAPEQRRHVLILRPFKKLTYANDLAVRAILELSRRPVFREMSFSIVGDGELFEETVRPLSAFDNVTLERQFLRHEEIVDYHLRHGVFLCPTRMDTQGVSRDEAMCSGLVPVTTNVGAVTEFVDDSCGFVVPPEDPVALADAMEQLQTQPDKFLRLSAAAASRVRSQSGADETIRREIELIGKSAR